MPVLIDCYNLLHTTMPPTLAGLDERGLCRVLARSRFAGERITIVCDGKPKPHAPAGSTDGISLIYSGPTRTADDVIVAKIRSDTAPRRLIVVSSDRQIQAAARRRRANVFSSQQFIHLLAPGAANDQPAAGRPTGSLTDDQVERWLAEFGLGDDERAEE
jgi:predicted RNA-binding protein with PIN domain